MNARLAPLEVRVTRDSHNLDKRPMEFQISDAAHFLRAGDTVVIGHGGAWPRAVIESMVSSADVPFTIIHNRIDDELPYFTQPTSSMVRHAGFMAGQTTRDHINDGAADFIPNCYGSTPLLLESGATSCDTVVLHISPPDANGWCSFGTCVAYLPAAVRSARLVLAQMNSQMPRTLGTSIHISAIDHVIKVSEALHAVAAPSADTVTSTIAANVAGLVQDGDVVQLGIGKLGDSVLRALSGKAGLRLWTETFSDSAINLLQDGTLSTGPNGEPAITATFVTGSAELYRSINSDPRIAMLPVDQTNSPVVLAELRQFIAINSALEIDLSGQINAESIGPNLYSGTGGHLDFATGASWSHGGRYVCAMPSTARTGSRIVTSLTAGAAVTVPRSLADIVVTEFGIAQLRGRSLHERAQALVNVAHPEHRPALRASISTLDEE